MKIFQKLRPYFPNTRRDALIFLISVLAFAAFMGIVVSPFLHLAFDLHMTLSPVFWIASIFFGLLVGLLNYLFFKIMDDSRKIAFLEDVAIDGRTGLWNRNFALRRWNEEFARSVRHRIPLSAVLIGIDSFKEIVAKHGTGAADEVFKAIAAVLKKDARACDVIGCYGEDAFLAILPGAQSRNAAIMAERLRWSIETTPVKAAGQEIAVTISAGISARPAVPADNPEEILSKTAGALAFAAESGGNQIALNHGDRIEPITVNLEPAPAPAAPPSSS